MQYFDSELPKRITKSIQTVILRGKEFKFHQESGLFSVQRVDPGTRLLVDHCIIPEEATVLDLGCGNGVVGVSIAILFPHTQVECCDINMHAVTLAKTNIKKFMLENCKAYRSDIYNKTISKFDTILTYPPFSAGRKVCYAFIDESILHLNENGTLQLVALHQKGGKMLQKRMEEVFGNVEVIAKKAGYRVYISRKS